jgi:transcriptional regulator with GAF, ATPase, and Fis domain
VPILVKYFGFDGLGGGRHLIVGRDLRPTIQLQQRVQQVLVEMEQRSEDRGHGTVRDLRLGDAAATIGERPLTQIVSETARTLERLCIDEALRRAQGNEAAAASLLGLPAEELAQRRRML